MSALGLEPRTRGLKGHCSSIELRARFAHQAQIGSHSIMGYINRQRNKTAFPGIKIMKAIVETI